MTHPFLAFLTDAVKTARRQPALAGLLSSTSLWTLSGLALVACGGGGHTDQPVRIRIYDGPVAGAKWGCDVDGDGILDPDEVQGRTDATGYIETRVSEYLSKFPLLADVAGATDLGSNLDDSSDDRVLAEGVWRAPVGSRIISPFNEQLVRMSEQPGHADKDLAALQKLLASQLGLSADTDFTSFDPFLAVLARFSGVGQGFGPKGCTQAAPAPPPCPSDQTGATPSRQTLLPTPSRNPVAAFCSALK
jgi:hypothetical protein